MAAPSRSAPVRQGGPAPGDVLGHVTLVTGKEEFLRERTVTAVRAAVRAHDAEAEMAEAVGADLTLGALGEMSAPSLFSSTRCVVVRELENLPEESVAALVDYAAAPAEDVALVLVHSGGPKGSGTLTKLRKLGPVTEVKTEELKPSEFPQFVLAEARMLGSRMDQSAAVQLVQVRVEAVIMHHPEDQLGALAQANILRRDARLAHDRRLRLVRAGDLSVAVAPAVLVTLADAPGARAATAAADRVADAVDADARALSTAPLTDAPETETEARLVHRLGTEHRAHAVVLVLARMIVGRPRRRRTFGRHRARRETDHSEMKRIVSEIVRAPAEDHGLHLNGEREQEPDRHQDLEVLEHHVNLSQDRGIANEGEHGCARPRNGCPNTRSPTGIR